MQPAKLVNRWSAPVVPVLADHTATNHRGAGAKRRSGSRRARFYLPYVSRPSLCLSRELAQQARDLAAQPNILLDVTGLKPVEVIKRLRTTFERNPGQREGFHSMARANAIMGNCPKSRESFRSGLCSPSVWARTRAYYGRCERLVHVFRSCARIGRSRVATGSRRPCDVVTHVCLPGNLLQLRGCPCFRRGLV